MDKARQAAVAALVRVHQGGFGALSLKSAFAKPSLSARDKAFAGALFYGAVERLYTLDYMLAPLLSRPMDKLDMEVRAILETGLYQPLFMQVPARAAVDEAANLARAFGKTSATGLVNAVLRKAVQLPLPAGPFESEEQRICVARSVSPAVAKAVMAAAPKEYDAFFEETFKPARLCLRANTFKTTEAELAGALEQRGCAVQQAALPGALYAQIPGGVLGDSLFENGHYYVQGEASQIAVHCLAPKGGHRVLDLCAAPGGKTATIAMLMRESGQNPPGEGITACELHENRLGLLRETMGRLGLGGVQVLQNDASIDNPNLRGFDRVLCDVPCSGLGVMGKKPDLRYGDGENYEGLQTLQAAILENGARCLSPGGRLVYSTCTIRREENEAVVESFLREHPSFRLVAPPVSPPGAAVQEKMMTIWPQKTGMDGFFVATLESL